MWRYRQSPKNTPDRTVGRYSGPSLCTVGRCNRAVYGTVGRYKGCVFLCTVGRCRRGNLYRVLQAVRASLECFGSACFIPWVSVQRTPCPGIPGDLVRALALHRLKDESCVQQFALCFGQHVAGVLAPACHVGPRQQQPAVVISPELSGPCAEPASCVMGSNSWRCLSSRQGRAFIGLSRADELGSVLVVNLVAIRQGRLKLTNECAAGPPSVR